MMISISRGYKVLYMHQAYFSQCCVVIYKLLNFIQAKSNFGYHLKYWYSNLEILVHYSLFITIYYSI